MKAYLIEKSSGSYEDYYSYVDKVFLDETKANEYVNYYNEQLNKDQEQSEKCNNCRSGKYQYLSHVLINCAKVRKSDITTIEKIDGDLFFNCAKETDWYVNDKHMARLIEKEISE